MERITRRVAGLTSHLAIGSDKVGYGDTGVPSLRPGATGPVVVVGGMVLDVQGAPAAGVPLSRGTTVPGSVRHAAGGVGRNIAECIAALTRDTPSPAPLLISTVGDDPAGQFLTNHLRQLGMESRGIRVSKLSTPCVAIVFDSTGEVGAAVADVAALEAPEEAAAHAAWIRKFEGDIVAAPLVLVDANLDAASVALVAEMASGAGVPVWFEPVSVTKAVRGACCLRHLAIVSPNQAELRAMALAAGYRPASSFDDGTEDDKEEGSSSSGGTEGGTSAEEELQRLAPYAGTLLARGCGAVVVTLGANGAAVLTLAGKGAVRAYLVGALPARVASLTGAGDSLVAGCVAAMVVGKMGLHPALHKGVAASKLAVESSLNVAKELGDRQTVEALTASARGRHLIIRTSRT